MTGKPHPDLPVSLAILTFADDLHALMIQAALRSRNHARCSIIEADKLADHALGVTWLAPSTEPSFLLPTRDGGAIDIADVDLIWFRRWNHPQQASRNIDDVAAAEVINRSCSTALLGGLLTGFSGAWVSSPDSTRRAENKLVQLRAAEAAGFRVPRTLISQVPETIRAFCSQLDGPVVIKPVQATARSQLFTVMVTPEHLEDDDALRLCPTIFQEYIPGRRHLRVLCCGDQTHTALIESDHLDWRLDLNTPITPYQLDRHIEHRLLDVVRRLGLRMGVADLKLGPDGEPIWLELNPQGQFLFVEGMTGTDLTGIFSDFLHREALSSRTRRNLTA